MQALKGLVIFMGVLIAIGVTVVGVTLYRRATDMVTADKAEPARIPPAAGTGATGMGSEPRAPRTFGVRALDLPAGSEIVSVQAVACCALVQALLPDGAVRLLVLDPASGEVRGEWRLDAVPDAPRPGAPNAMPVP